MLMIIAPNYRAHRGKEERGEVKGLGIYARVCGEEEGNADYGGRVQPSQQHVVPCVKVVEWGFGTRGLRMLAAFWAGIPVEDTQDAGVVPRLLTRCHWDTLLVASYDTQENGRRILPPTHRGYTPNHSYIQLPEFLIFSLEKICFLLTSNLVLIKNWL